MTGGFVVQWFSDMDSIGFDLYMYCLSTGWKHTDFDWTEYLKECQATAAPDSAFTNLVSGTTNSSLNGCHLIFRGKSLQLTDVYISIITTSISIA